jgi:hypothetical protein
MFKAVTEVKGYTPTLAITTNASVNSHGELVMGAGAAKALARHMPHLPKAWGAGITELGRSYPAQSTIRKPITPVKPYGIYTKERGAIAIQVKFGWWEKASTDLIKFSIRQLADYAQHLKPGEEFWLNYPGIGMGGLLKQDVEPLLAPLPDNVILWTF